MPTVADVEQFLTLDLVRTDATGVQQIGRGAWSTAFGFRDGGRDLVIRLGRDDADFRRDQAMSMLASAELPIPEVLDVGRATGIAGTDDLSYCISTRAFGEPLEHCDTDRWTAIVEPLADALEAMRHHTPPTADPPGPRSLPWHEQLLAIDRDDLGPRMTGWRTELARSERGTVAFTHGIAALRDIDVADVPPTLVHGDLINRNVHVDGGRITGIFDWGCQRWGDHLFDLAWFEFWSPWHPDLDLDLLRDALRRRWSSSGHAPDREAERTRACLVYIGLEHLVYNAVMGSWTDLDDVVDRMTALDLL